MTRFILSLLCLCTYVGVQAQGIKSGSKWNIGELDYTAKVNNDRSITLTAMAEGEELAFKLTSVSGKADEYVVGEDPNADGFNPYDKASRAKFINERGWRLICLYDPNGSLLNVLDGTQSNIDELDASVVKHQSKLCG